MQSRISGYADAAACGSDILRLPRWRGEEAKKVRSLLGSLSWRERSERFESQKESEMSRAEISLST